MNNIGQHKQPAEPDRELVERAIAKVLEIAHRQGISATDFIQMLDSGIRISDFLNAIDVFTNAGPTVAGDTVNRDSLSVIRRLRKSEATCSRYRDAWTVASR